jgi:hypothetical protein
MNEKPRCENCDHAYAAHHWSDRWGDHPFQGCTVFDCACSGYTATATLDELLEMDTRFGNGE